MAKTVLPYSDQQIGGTLGGPIVMDKMHYFASYEYERQPGTIFSAPAGLSGQTFTFPTKTTQRSLLARVDAVLSNKDSLSIRGSRWDWSNPFNLGGGSYPSTANVLDRYATNVLGTWSKVINSNTVQQVRVGLRRFLLRPDAAVARWSARPNSTFPG